MPRPIRCRRICELPRNVAFGPMGKQAEKGIVMGVDEFETIRLIDLEGLTQEACAAQMGVGRTTAQAIYGSARQKLAQCLVEGMALTIHGGDYVLCQGDAPGCGRGCRQGRRCGYRHGADATKTERFEEETTMRIAVTYEDGKVFQHFGHTEQFKLYDVEEGQVKATEVISTDGNGHGALARFLQEHKVDTLICGGIGGGAQQALALAGINLYGGVKGDADQAVADLLAEQLAYDPQARCDHHDHAHGADHDCHGHGHTCGGHCGAHE